jgi:uncharacterized HAD superfamily protein
MIPRHAIVDLDDTLGCLREVLMETMNHRFKTTVHWDSWGQLSMEALYGITNDHFLEIALETQLLERSRPHQEAREFMYALFDADVTVEVLTARSWHPRAKLMTESWLGLYDLPYSKVTVCALEDDKASYIRNTPNVILTVDDSVRHCNSYATMTKNRPTNVFVYDMPWNQNKIDSSVIRINNLQQILEYM